MAFKQTLIHRMLNICNNKFSNQTLRRNCRISPSSSSLASQLFIPDKLAPDRPKTVSMLEKLKEMDITKGRIRVDDVLSPPPPPPPVKRLPELRVAEVQKIVRAFQVEKLKRKIRRSGKNHVSYEEYVEMCVEECFNRRRDLGLDMAKALDDSGDVIVLGDIVFLNPQQVVKAIHGLLPKNPPPLKDLEEMEQWKSVIDGKAKKMVQRELWGGLGYLIVQTAVLMRLTFWELSWDVMEPICFYVTSMYFMGGYTFFLRTAKEPSFEGFYQSRFSWKQNKLMERQGFDVNKYRELRKACYPDPHQQEEA